MNGPGAGPAVSNLDDAIETNPLTARARCSKICRRPSGTCLVSVLDKCSGVRKMSPERDLSTSVAVVRMAGDDGRLIFFADPRSDVVEAFRTDENDVERTVVALAIEEEDAVVWEMEVHLSTKPWPTSSPLSRSRSRPGDTGFRLLWSSGSTRRVESSRTLLRDDVEEAKSHIDFLPGATWESLATDADVAEAFVSQRLVAAPHGRQ